MVWGGDATVTTIRTGAAGAARPRHRVRRPLLACRDRRRRVAGHGEADRDGLARRLFADVFFFDQQGCSSPRLIVWCGEGADAASDDLMAGLQAESCVAATSCRPPRRPASSPPSPGSRSTGRCAACARISNELNVVSLSSLDELPRDVSAPGLLLEASLPTLADLGPLLCRHDQTLVVHGFCADDIDALLDAAAGRGLDRIVALGNALRFSIAGTAWTCSTS